MTSGGDRGGQTQNHVSDWETQGEVAKEKQKYI